MTYSDYVIYVDESGDHTLTAIDRDYPVFMRARAALADCLWEMGEHDETVPGPKRNRFLRHRQLAGLLPPALKEQLLWVPHFATVEDLRQGLAAHAVKE